MCGGGGSPPQQQQPAPPRPKPKPQPTGKKSPDDKGVSRKARGRSRRTILTGGPGVQEEATTRRKTLLG